MRGICKKTKDNVKTKEYTGVDTAANEYRSWIANNCKMGDGKMSYFPNLQRISNTVDIWILDQNLWHSGKTNILLLTQPLGYKHRPKAIIIDEKTRLHVKKAE